MHRGSMDVVMPTIQTLARWIDANGYRSAGYNRELYHRARRGQGCVGDGAPGTYRQALKEEKRCNRK